LTIEATGRTLTDVETSCPNCGQPNRFPASKADRRAHCGKCKTPILPLAAPQPIGSAAEFDELVANSPLPVVVDFWAEWCGPCHTVAPQLERLARERTGSVVVAKVDTEALPEVASRFGIRGIPTFIAFRQGREATRATGAMPADAIASALQL
jgi:thioredoxin 2